MIRSLIKQIELRSAFLRKNPNFLIIGAQKAGTSSLYSFLKKHPEIQMPRVKEIHYFDNNYDKGLHHYRSFFPLNINNKITGEASPYYLFHPLAPERVAKAYPSIKLIAILRDPVERAVSHYKHNIRLGIESRTMEECFDEEFELLKGEEELLLSGHTVSSFKHQNFSYLSRGFYYKQLLCWEKFFPGSQMILVDFKKLVQTPGVETNRIFKYLNVKPFAVKDFPQKNVSRSEKSGKELAYEYKQLFADDLAGLKQHFNFEFES